MKNRHGADQIPFYPVPSALMTFHSASGAPRLLVTGWVGLVCSRPAVLSFPLKGAGGDPGDLPWARNFTINLPPEELLGQPAYRELLAREDIGLLASLGLSLGNGTVNGSPLIAECPIKIECGRATCSSRFGQGRVSGEVVAVHIDQETYGLESPLDLCRLKPFTRRLPLPTFPATLPEIGHLEGRFGLPGFSLT